MRARNIIYCVFILMCFLVSPVRNSITTNTENYSSNTNPYPILFVHGWEETGNAWSEMKTFFLQDGWQRIDLYTPTYTEYNRYDYYSNLNQSNDIKTFVDNLMNWTGASKINIVAHSMGVTVARYYVKFLGGIDKVDNFISLGGINHGKLSGWVLPNGSIYQDLNEGDETPGGVLPDTIGPRPDPFGTTIWNGTHVPGSINYYSIYSDSDKEAPNISAVLDGAVNIELNPGPSHPGLTSQTSMCNLVDSIINRTYSSTVQSSSSKSSNSTPGFTFIAILAIPILLELNKKRINR